MVTGDYSIYTGTIHRFGAVDYFVFVLTLIISAGIGLFYAIWDRKRNTTKDFLLAGKSMNPFPVAMSLMVTFMSALTLQGNPAEIYNYNTMYWWLVVAFVFAITGAAFLFIPFFYDLHVTSTFEFLEMRFSSSYVMKIGSALLIAQTIVYMALLLYAPSLALNAVTGLNLWGSVIGMGVVVTFYTSLGGMKAVVWTDTFQAAIIFAGILAVLIQGSILQGGFLNAWEIADNRSRILFDDFNLDPRTRHSVWSMVVGGMLFWVFLYGMNQAQVQRCLACSSLRRAQVAMFINLPGLVLIVSLCSMVGVVMFAFYSDCHPLSYGIINKTDQLLPLYVMDILGNMEGVPGIVVSCIVSGSLSSLSSGLNALSAVTFKDWIQSSSCYKNISEFRSAIVSKMLVVMYGVVAICLAYVVSMLGNVLTAAYVMFGILNGPLLGLMTLGMFFPWANKWGAMVGTVSSLALLLWIGLGALVNDLTTPLTYTLTTACNWTARPPTTTVTPLTTTPVPPAIALEPLYRVSYMWYPAIGMLSVWLIGLTVSAFTGFIKPTSLDPRLILPIFDKLFPYLPERILKPLRFGIVHEGKYNLPPIRSVNKIVQPESNGSAPTGDDKESTEVTGDYVKPTFYSNGVTSNDVRADRKQGQDNVAFSSGDDGDAVIVTRL